MFIGTRHNFCLKYNLSTVSVYCIVNKFSQLAKNWKLTETQIRITKQTQNQKNIVSKMFKGIKKTKEHKDKLPFNILNKKTIKCPHCNKIGQYINMKRWHFDNCKSMGKERKNYTCSHCSAVGTLPNIMNYHFDRCKNFSIPK